MSRIDPENDPQDAGGTLLFWRPPEREVDHAVDHVLTGLPPRLRAAAREKAEAPSLLAELLSHPPTRREMLARGLRRFRNLPLCGLLLQRSHEISVDAPGEAEEIANLALALTRSLDRGWYGSLVLADALGRCWMMIGNARRIAADLDGAEEAFRQAGEHLRQGTGDPMEKAQLLVHKAFLRQAQHRLDEAAALFRRTVSIFLSAGEPLHAAESIVELALVEQDRGGSKEAAEVLSRADVLVELRDDPLRYVYSF